MVLAKMQKYRKKMNVQYNNMIFNISRLPLAPRCRRRAAGYETYLGGCHGGIAYDKSEPMEATNFIVSNDNENLKQGLTFAPNRNRRDMMRGAHGRACNITGGCAL